MARSERGLQPRDSKGRFQSYDYNRATNASKQDTTAAKTGNYPNSKGSSRTVKTASQPRDEKGRFQGYTYKGPGPGKVKQKVVSSDKKSGSQPHDKKGRFAPKVAPLPAEERKKITTWREGRINNKASGGNLYGIVVRVTKNGKEISHHNVVQATPELDRSGRQMIRDRVEQKYKVTNINIEIVQTVNMWTGERVQGGIVR